MAPLGAETTRPPFPFFVKNIPFMYRVSKQSFVLDILWFGKGSQVGLNIESIIDGNMNKEHSQKGQLSVIITRITTKGGFLGQIFMDKSCLCSVELQILWKPNTHTRTHTCAHTHAHTQ